MVLLEQKKEIFFKKREIVFEAIDKADKLSSSSVIKIIKNSGLRGRGGAGFPTGLKWDLVNKEKAFPKYIVCNAHEGEPETLKDKYLLENYPHLVLAGIVIAAKTLKSEEIFIAIKETYVKAIVILKKEISYFKKKGILKNIKVSLFPAKLGYIGGEETALLNELEGKRVEPRNKPPFVSQEGYLGKPTLVNNVESYSNIPFIVNFGANAYRKFGTLTSPGKKLITVSGDVQNPGVKEVEFGKTINEILEIAGGLKGKIKPALCSAKQGSIKTKNLPKQSKDCGVKFALTGGFAGTVVTPDKSNIPFEYDAFKNGIAVGAGTIIFYNNETNLLQCMKDWLKFFSEQSCGQCTPCREGTFRLYEIIKKVESKFSKDDVKRMEEIFNVLDNSSFCALGSSVSMATKGLINSFREELISE